MSRPLEYRVCWNASSNISFSGATDWEEWGGAPDETADQIEESLCRAGGGIAEGLDMAIEGSGFSWWVETREAEHA